jgi:hypothetical protein
VFDFWFRAFRFTRAVLPGWLRMSVSVDNWKAIRLFQACSE